MRDLKFGQNQWVSFSLDDSLLKVSSRETLKFKLQLIALSHLSAYVVNRLLRGNRVTIPKSLSVKKMTPFCLYGLSISPTSQPTKQIFFSDGSVLWSDSST